MSQQAQKITDPALTAIITAMYLLGEVGRCKKVTAGLGKFAVRGLVATAFLLCYVKIATADPQLSYKPIYKNADQFLQAITRERPKEDIAIEVSGISVPHHLLALDLTARGFWLAASNNYDRIVVLSPDHFSKSHRAFATTRSDFDTPFGLAANDTEVTNKILSNSELFDDSDLFENEHGVAAILPFAKYFFPNARIVPIAVSSRSTRDDWDAATEMLRGLISSRTLIVQSTDYSHYLPLGIAVRRDQETLNVISAGDISALNGLIQPKHMDSKGSQYIQMRLQAEKMNSTPVVIANRSSVEYGADREKTTSYVVTAYLKVSETGNKLRYDDQEVLYFGGDTFLGRWLTAPLMDDKIFDVLIQRIKKVTGGAPIILNLEGVLLDELPMGLGRDLHAMPAKLATKTLRALNVKAVSVANNHSRDLGDLAYKRSVIIARQNGIIPLEHMRPINWRKFSIVGINFVGPSSYKSLPAIRSESELMHLCRTQARSPLIAFVHWGKEFRNVAEKPEYQAAEALRSCGVSVIIGAHSHQASSKIEARAGGEYQMVYSLGNLLFDQRGSRASNAMLEVRIFRQGTVAARLIALPNLYDIAVPTISPGSGADQREMPR